MQHKHLEFDMGLQVVSGDEHAQAAPMTRALALAEGGRGNQDHGADQWPLIVSGTGQAVVNGETVPLKAGTLLIERGDTHESRDTGRGRCEP